jgi:hydroxyethylthiazole kinase
MDMLTEISKNLEELRTKNPLVHHITNYVTVNDCANITLAIGASPVMADDIGEVEEMVTFASSLVINIGTLNARTVASMLTAGKKAKALKIPVILDPVGAGATRMRTETAANIIATVRPDVIRGNMSEIKILAGATVAIKGVDSVASEQDGAEIAGNLAQKLGCVVAITGKRDIIADGQKICLLDNGHEMLAKVTGTGCMTTSLVGSYCGVCKDYFSATVAGIVSMGIAGELARESLSATEGTGTFRVKLFDAVYGLTPEILRNRGRVTLE